MNTPNFETVNMKIENHIAEIELNRPKSLNSLNRLLKIEVGAAFDYLQHMIEDENTLHGVIIHGGGDKAFAAGADVKEFIEMSPHEAFQFALAGQKLLKQIESFPRPVIAAIHGFALGGGSELALACHMRIAGPDAILGQPEVNLGVMCGFGGTQRLIRYVGRAKATEITLTGDYIDAEEAYRIGLVNQVVKKGEEMSAARAMIQKIGEKGALAVEYTLTAINRGYEVSLEEGLHIEAQLFGLCFATEDCKEGISAFLEKRKPNFTGS